VIATVLQEGTRYHNQVSSQSVTDSTRARMGLPTKELSNIMPAIYLQFEKMPMSGKIFSTTQTCGQ